MKSPSTRTSRLQRVGELLGIGDALVAAAERLVDAGEPYELGLALSVSGDRRGVLLSYNPRQRHPDRGARGRMLQVLAAHGLPVAPVRAAFSWVAEDRSSTVLGLEWVAGQVEATVYLEELSRFWDPAGVERLTGRVAKAVGQPVPDWGEDTGEPYILALDLEESGVVALKTYRWAEGVSEQLAARFLGEEEASGWILQRKHPGVRTSDITISAGPPLKVYKTFAYESGGGGEQAAAELQALLGRDERVAAQVVAAMAGVPMTSIGLRLGEGGVQTVTGYWCLERGPPENA